MPFKEIKRFQQVVKLNNMRKFNIQSLSAVSLKALILFSITCSGLASASLHVILQHQTKAYVEQNIMLDDNADLSIEVSDIDPRINIEPCDKMYNFEASESSLRQQNVSVKISCPSSSWYLFTNVQVMQTKPIVVSAEVLSPGVLLTKENTQLVDTPINRLRSSAFSYIEEIEGARLKRRIRPGQIITRSMLCFVCKGDRIVISANGSGLTLRTSGIAQQDGNVGDTIRVQNIGSKKLVSAVVASTNQVNVAF